MPGEDPMPLTWGDSDDAIIGGDLTAALAYVTPAGGVVVAAVAPIGLRDRAAGTVGFTTSLGFGRKLERIRKNPRVALAYHAREHGFCSDDGYVLVQGRASYDSSPDRELLDSHVRPASVRFMGPPKHGRFWDRWLREYYADRIIVTVEVDRVVSWSDSTCSAEPRVVGEALGTAAPQAPPAKGVEPRLDAARAASRARALPHVLVGFVGADGLPVVVPVQVQGADGGGLKISTPPGLLPGGGRRAGLLAHRYQPRLIGLESRQYTGWLEGEADGSAVYAPHTESGFRAPANKTLLLLANGLLAKRGFRRAQRTARRSR